MPYVVVQKDDYTDHFRIHFNKDNKEITKLIQQIHKESAKDLKK